MGTYVVDSFPDNPSEYYINGKTRVESIFDARFSSIFKSF